MLAPGPALVPSAPELASAARPMGRRQPESCAPPSGVDRSRSPHRALRRQTRGPPSSPTGPGETANQGAAAVALAARKLASLNCSMMVMPHGEGHDQAQVEVPHSGSDRDRGALALSR